MESRLKQNEALVSSQVFQSQVRYQIELSIIFTGPVGSQPFRVTNRLVVLKQFLIHYALLMGYTYSVE